MTSQETSELQDEYEMTAVTEEERAIWRWRFEQLLRNGYSEVGALLLASDRTVDLEHARRLVARLSCPPELALRILL
jgi:hypothetical protein